MVNEEGMNQYPIAGVWLTDGYGDYVRHYLRSMAVFPELAPDNENHVVSSTETVRMTRKPSKIWMSGQYLEETESIDVKEGWTWQPLDIGGILTIRHDQGNKIAVLK